MPSTPENPGTCAYCGEVISKRSVRKHLEKCPRRRASLLCAEALDLPKETVWHLRIQDAYKKDFWLDLEMRGSSALTRLDAYLRAIWLECCGHLSQFTIGGWGGIEVGKSRKADTVFESGLVLRLFYDFGTTSETNIEVVSCREGKQISRHSITLLARNLMPEKDCQECGRSASWRCLECIYEDDNPGFLCDQHAENHPHIDYGGPIPLVNSPRLGMCAYEGPAEPPY